ncbi:helix-turn-helix domain-containing protein [Rhizobium alvei]|uniref:AraC family transcriptional regulator n=1 Tax=Rhizobium alvei TaxID=1132659 RepID=A0ABT8YT37_9HYPH|nr:AraC family transcriptional regulator [Rhizobium alvei]MDO6966504.1 AraC family transcriptional regulator [Rhizobium alvei]
MDTPEELHLRFAETESPVETHAIRNWRGVSVQFSRLKLPTEYEFQWDGNCHYLAHHDLILADGEMEVLGEKPIAAKDLRDKMTYVPKGQTINGWAAPADRMNAFTVVSFDPAAMEEELAAEFNGPNPVPHIYFQDVELGATMRKLARMMGDERKPASKAYAETLGLTAALEMFRLSHEATSQIFTAGRLTAAQIRLLHDYIDQNLAQDIGLDELASLCGLTRFHFARAFKASFGEPPYQYLMRKRIELARQLLLTTKHPVAEIAAATGFNGASQFGRAFRDLVGQSPLAFRRNA